MLEYSKIILENVSFDAQLFHKELMKLVKSLVDNEREELLMWCVSRYQYPWNKSRSKNNVMFDGKRTFGVSNAICLRWARMDKRSKPELN